MTHNDSHLMALIDELKQSRNVMDQKEVKTLAVLEGLLKRIEQLEKNQMAIANRNPSSWGNISLSNGFSEMY